MCKFCHQEHCNHIVRCSVYSLVGHSGIIKNSERRWYNDDGTMTMAQCTIMSSYHRHCTIASLHHCLGFIYFRSHDIHPTHLISKAVSQISMKLDSIQQYVSRLYCVHYKKLFLLLHLYIMFAYYRVFAQSS